MPQVIPLGEPSRLVAGDTWQWRQVFSGYPVSEGWALSYAINGASVLPWDAAWVATDNQEFSITIPASANAALAGGRYELVPILTGSGTYAGFRKSQPAVYAPIEANPTAAAEGDRQPNAEKELALVRAAIHALTKDRVQSYVLAGRQFSLLNIEALYRREASLVDQILRAKRGGGFRKHLVTFSAIS